MELDTSCFKAFKYAAQTLNFTEAAVLARMTQSGVSHHIAKLERDLGAELFLRVGKKVQLTFAGRELLNFIENYQDQVEALHNQIHESSSVVKGFVRYSMPESCLLSPHFSLLLKDKSKNFEDVDLKMNLNHSEKVIEDVLSHEIDFGFVTKKIINQDLNYEAFCDEEYVLISSVKNKNLNLQNLKWIRYPGFDDISSKWLSAQTKMKRIDFHHVAGQTNSLRAAMTMVSHDMGCTIAPRHCVETFDDRKNINIVESGFTSAKNQIFIVTLQGYKKPLRVAKIIEAFRKMKAD